MDMATVTAAGLGAFGGTAAIGTVILIVLHRKIDDYLPKSKTLISLIHDEIGKNPTVASNSDRLLKVEGFYTSKLEEYMNSQNEIKTSQKLMSQEMKHQSEKIKHIDETLQFIVRGGRFGIE